MKHKVLRLSFLVLALGACSRSERPAAQAAAPDSSCGPAPTSEAEAALANQRKSFSDGQQSGKTSDSKSNDQANVAAVVSVLSWHLCNARSNGWIDDNFYRTQFVAMRDESFAQFGVIPPKPASPPDETSASQAP
jgi:hypothetical protein